MLFEYTSLLGSGKEIIQRVMAAEKSQLLVPPVLQGMQLDISNPPDNGKKYIGLFSSGTTGTPTCIWNDMEKLELNARRSGQVFGVGPSDFCLMMAKPWHVAGFSWMLMAEFIDCEYLFVTTYKGEHDFWIKTIQDINPDYLFTVPQVLRALYNETWFADKVVYGGSSINYEEYEQLAPHCRFMYQAYGQTEAGGLISCHKRKSTVIPEADENLCHGKPMTGVILTCEGTKEKPRPIYIQSETAALSHSYDSGDLGYMNSEGDIYLLGRGREKGEMMSKMITKQTK